LCSAPTAARDGRRSRRPKERQLADLLHIAIRTAHIVASAAWLGGSLFYALVLGPVLAESEAVRGLSPRFGLLFGRVVGISAWTLLGTGAYLTVERLSDQDTGTPYALTLALKIALAVWMFLLAGAISRNRGKPRIAVEARGAYARWRGLLPVPSLILYLGLLVFLLSSALTTIYGNG